MSTQVLILSSVFDFATDEVAQALEDLGVSYVRLNKEHLPEHRLLLDPSAPKLRISGAVGDHVIDDSLESIFFRQPVFYRNSPGRVQSLTEQLQRTQWHAFLQALSVFQRATWMNRPAATYAAESKPYQLSMARSCGFTIPDTIVSNESHWIREKFPNEFAVKSVDTVIFRDGEQQLFPYTSIVSASEVTEENLIAAPVIAQEVIRNKVDLRVTVVGETVFPVRIVEEGEGIDGDWRLRNKESLEFEDHVLDEGVSQRCVEVVQKLGLSYGAIDLAESRNGTTFIEVNPTGEWGWLSSPSRPISQTIAGWLSESGQ